MEENKCNCPNCPGECDSSKVDPRLPKAVEKPLRLSSNNAVLPGEEPLSK